MFEKIKNWWNDADAFLYEKLFKPVPGQGGIGLTGGGVLGAAKDIGEGAQQVINVIKWVIVFALIGGLIFAGFWLYKKYQKA